MNKNIFAMIIISFFLQINNCFANDYIPQTCDNMTDEGLYIICVIAKQFQTPFYETSNVFMLADIEATAFYCNFKTNFRFNNAKNKIRLTHVYNFLIKNSTGHFDNSYCRKHYEIFGPTSSNNFYD